MRAGEAEDGPHPTIGDRDAYRVVPDQVTISGSFRRIAQYLHGLESQPILFTVEWLQLKSESEQASEMLKADLTFSIFAKRASFVGFSEKGDSLAQTQADDSLKQGQAVRRSWPRGFDNGSTLNLNEHKRVARADTQAMNRSSFSKPLVCDMQASAGRTAVLALLLLAGFFFWVPPLLKAFSSGATTAPLASVDTKATSGGLTASPASPESVKKPRESKALLKLSHEQPLLYPVRAEDALAEPSPGLKPIEKFDGLVLKSTLVGPSRRVAVINNQLFREGQSVSWNDRQLLLESVNRKSVTLTDGSQSWQLALKDSPDESKD